MMTTKQVDLVDKLDYPKVREYKKLLDKLARGNNKEFPSAMKEVIAFEEKEITRLKAKGLSIPEDKTLFDVLVEEATPARPVSKPIIFLGGIAAVAAMVAIIFGILIVAPQFLPVPPTESPQVALAVDVEPAIIVLNGAGEYLRDGWENPQPLTAGISLQVDDQIFPASDALRVVCPNGQIAEATQIDLASNSCIDTDVTVIAQRIAPEVSQTRSGIQSSDVPYLIEPRASLITEQMPLRWNAVANASFYRVTIFNNVGEVVFLSDDLNPDDIVTDGVADFAIPVPLETGEDIAYSVEICAQLNTRVCTTDVGIATSVNTAFYIVPNPQIDATINQWRSELGADNPETLYLTGLLLSSPWGNTLSGDALGYYNEALSAYEELASNFPEHPLVQADLFNRIGDLYLKINLPESAESAYRQAYALSASGTPAAAAAAIGIAASDASEVPNFYDIALDEYASFLTQDSFESRFAELCAELGTATCTSLARCQPADMQAQCESWSQGEK